MIDEARSCITGLDWWHAIEVAPGVVTARLVGSSSDCRMDAVAAGDCRSPVPRRGDDGRLWAFELERRGAREVVAIDPAAVTGPRPRERFRVAAELLGSRAEYRDLDVYDLDPAAIGEFDLIVMGYVLQMLRDPLRGLEAVRSVCRGHLILLDTVSLPLSLLPAPLARLDARRDGTEWFVFNRRKALRLAGFEVEAVTSILRDRGNPARGVEGGRVGCPSDARARNPGAASCDPRASPALVAIGRSGHVRGQTPSHVSNRRGA